MRKPKYELTDETITLEDGTVLHRIRALKRFGSVKKGDFGGYIEGYKNLSQNGNCWVYGQAKVYQNAWVADDAAVCGQAQVKGHATVSSHAYVDECAVIKDYARVSGRASVLGNSIIHSAGEVDGLVWVDCNAKVGAPITQTAHLVIEDNATIISAGDVAFVSGFGSCGRGTTFYRGSSGSVRVRCGCFRGTLDEFREKVKQRHGEDSTLGKEYLAVADLMALRFNVQSPVQPSDNV